MELYNEVFVVDGLSTSRRENVLDGNRLHTTNSRSGCARIFEEYEPEIFAQQGAWVEVGHSGCVQDSDALVRVLRGSKLLQDCIRCGREKGSFASTYARFYSDQKEYRATIGYLLDPISL